MMIYLTPGVIGAHSGIFFKALNLLEEEGPMAL
jgi:hypothetical protein